MLGFNLFFTLLPLALIVGILWCLYDLGTHWEETENNVLWLLVMLVSGLVGAIFYYILVYKPRQNS